VSKMAVSIFGGRFEGDIWMADESSLDVRGKAAGP
jgi:hypothetical protein